MRLKINGRMIPLRSYRVSSIMAFQPKQCLVCKLHTDRQPICIRQSVSFPRCFQFSMEGGGSLEFWTKVILCTVCSQKEFFTCTSPNWKSHRRCGWTVGSMVCGDAAGYWGKDLSRRICFSWISHTKESENGQPYQHPKAIKHLQLYNKCGKYPTRKRHSQKMMHPADFHL